MLFRRIGAYLKNRCSPNVPATSEFETAEERKAKSANAQHEDKLKQKERGVSCLSLSEEFWWVGKSKREE